jgi:Ca2+-binding EF-hand superfamily protein
MRDSWGFAVRLLAGVLVIGLSMALAAEDPPRTGMYLNQLRSMFTACDKNKDDSLDKGELAVAFYGAGTKPYDYAETKKKVEAEKKESEKKEDEETTTTTETKEKPKEKTKKAPDYSSRGDYQFLTLVDKDKDGKISKDEFMEWAREYAIQLRDQADAQRELAKLLEQKNNPKTKNKKSVDEKIKKQQKQIDELEAKLAKYAKLRKQLKGS